MRIAVIIPTLNEEGSIRGTVETIRERGDPEAIIVADCGSGDGTRSIAAASGAAVVAGPALHSRGGAMRAGAEHAGLHYPDAETLWFVHADSIAPPGWDKAIAAALAHPRVVGGAFHFRFHLHGLARAARLELKLVTVVNWVRYRTTRCYYGDQGIFVRRDALRRIGGVPEMPLMEDAHLCRRLKKIGRLRLAEGKMRTSPRRFLHHGVGRQFLIDTALALADRLGLRSARVHNWYNRSRG